MIKRIQYWIWKRRAKKAVKFGLTTTCRLCSDPIIPGDFVGILLTYDDEQVLAHAGFHFSMTEIDAFCEIGGVGCAYWDGENVIGLGESQAFTAIRTGKSQYR